MSLTIRPLVAADLPAADRILQAAFQRAHSFEPMLRLNGATQPGNQCVAVVDGQVVATVGAVDFGRLAYVALMGVHPEYHRRGIARRMMQHVLDRLDAQGCPTVLLDATDAGATLYEQLDFVDDGSAYEYERTPTAQATEATRGIERMTDEMLSEVAAFDAPRFGADRSGLLQILLDETPQRALVYRADNGRVAGYAFARNVLGPWVVADEQAAECLFAAAASLFGAEQLRVLVPRSNERATRFLSRHGLRQVRRLRHMRRGGNHTPGMPGCLFGQVSFGLG